eukprot:2823836-Lingulodinium_polyedra.AAC.1
MSGDLHMTRVVVACAAQRRRVANEASAVDLLEEFVSACEVTQGVGPVLFREEAAPSAIDW